MVFFASQGGWRRGGTVVEGEDLSLDTREVLSSLGA
jgi:hypothetical protein